MALTEHAWVRLARAQKIRVAYLGDIMCFRAEINPSDRESSLCHAIRGKSLSSACNLRTQHTACGK